MSIHKTKSGSYQVRWRVLGKLKSKNFDRKIDAAQFEAKLKIQPDSHSVDSEIVQPEESLSFKDFVDVWLRNYAAVYKDEGTIKNDRQILRTYLLPDFGSLELKKISKRDIADLQGKLSAEGRLAPKTINNIVGLIHTILKTAVEWSYIKENPSAGIPQIKIPEQDFMFWTFDERDKFLLWASINDPELYDIVATAVYTGLRRGEMQALRRECIDFERKLIVVKRSYCKHTRRVKDYTKSKKIRRVPMNDAVYRIMLERSLWPKEALVLEADYDHLLSYWFGPAEKKAEVTRITFHDLRHTFASHLAMSGVSPFAIQKLMGHSDIKTTMRYMHLAPDHLSGMTDVLLGVKKAHSKNFKSAAAG